MFSYEEIQKYNETDIRIYKYIICVYYFPDLCNTLFTLSEPRKCHAHFPGWILSLFQNN